MVGGPRRRPLVSRSVFGQRADRNPRHLVAVPQRAEQLVIGDAADHHGVEIPFVEDLFNRLFAAALGDQEHAFLRLREQNLVGRHALFAQGDA